MKNKPLLNESTVRKFMKLANLGRVGEGFIAENYNQEETLDEENELEESELAEDKNFGGTKDHKMKPLKAKSSKKVMNEEEEVDVVPGDDDAGAETPDMGDAPEIEPAEEPGGEMEASDLAQKIIDVLQGAGLVDVVDDEDGEGGEDVNVDLEEPEDEEEGEDENYMDDSQYEEGDMMESKKANLTRVIAERVKTRLARESKIEHLAETITSRVIARAKRES